MSHTRAEDMEFENNYKPLITNLISNIFEVVNHIKPSKVSYSTYNKDSGQNAADRFSSIDVNVSTPGLPNDTIQIKGRRFKQFNFFKRNPDLMISLKKVFKSGFECDGDYVKCNSRYYLYVFLNENQNGIIYWSLINWYKLREKFNMVGGWKNLHGVFSKDITDGDGTVSTCIVIPWFHVRDCIIVDKDQFEHPIEKMDSEYLLF